MSRRTRRTLPGTLAPGDAYAPSLFGDTGAHAAPPAPLALFATDVGAAVLPPLTRPALPCAVCGDVDHLTAGCPNGAPVALFGPEQDDNAHRSGPRSSTRADGPARRWTDAELRDDAVVATDEAQSPQRVACAGCPDSFERPALSAVRYCPPCTEAQVWRTPAHLARLADTGPTPFLRRKAADALAAHEAGDEAEVARIVAVIEAQR